MTPAGDVTTLAGAGYPWGYADGAGAAALFQSPAGITVGSDGSIYVADTGTDTIRKITQAGVVTTVAGTAYQRGFAPGAMPGALPEPRSVAWGCNGTLYVLARQGVIKLTGVQ